ncbi:hypothetical protein K8T06_05245 [bacterium]|nr:hypothetical protein [bacterium]
MTTILKTGIILLFTSIGMWIYENEFENVLPYNPDLDVWIGTAGGVLIAIFLLIYIYSLLAGTTAKWGKKSRCVRCGVKIPKNKMYCEFHGEENADKFLRNTSSNDSSY